MTTNKLKVMVRYLLSERGILRELDVLREGLSRRVKVENDIAVHIQKGTLPSADELRRWRVELGVPEKYRSEQTTRG